MTSLRFGVLLMPRSLETTRRAARLLEEAGIDWFGIADSPAVFEDATVHVAEALRVTERLAVGPMATHVVIRHPLVLANQLSTLQELSGGRVVATVATGNSGARGLGLKPSTLAELEAAIAFCHSYWRGEGGTWGTSVVPPSGLARLPVPLVVAGDGPKTIGLGARIADGLLYSGAIDPTTFAARATIVRDAARTGPPADLPWSSGGTAAGELWVAAASSTAADLAGARAELGAALVAIANRALRGGDLAERGIPEDLHDDVAAMRAAYDYAVHGTFERPRNAEALTDRLAAHLLETLCLVGDADAWAATLDRLAADGLAGFTFIVNQADELGTIERIVERLRHLGLLRPHHGNARR